MQNDINFFESLGCNCEFGFYLRDHGNEKSTLFKWAEIHQVRYLIDILSSNFQDNMLLENIEPFNLGMVFDKRYKIGWHTHLRSKVIDVGMPPIPGNLVFVDDENRREEIWKDQVNKTEFLINRFRESAKDPRTIFVYKAYWKEDLALDQVLDLSKVLAEFGLNNLLVVTKSKSSDVVGSVRMVGDRVALGYIDRYAPGSNAGDYSEAIWDQLVLNARSSFNV